MKIILKFGISGLEALPSLSTLDSPIDWVRKGGKETSNTAQAAVVLLSVATLVLLLGTTGCGGSTATQNGLLAVSRSVTPGGLTGQIWVVAPTGKGLRRLTHDRSDDESPSWSPNGRWIAYTRGSDIYLMDAQGRHQRLLTRSHHPESLAWAPDGRRLAYEADELIYTFSLRVAEPHLLATRSYAYEPAWSPDGRRIAFAGDTGIIVVDANGAHLTRLTDNKSDASPVWSPDGKTIAFLRQKRGLTAVYNIYLMDSDGHHQRALTNGAPVSGRLAWAPNGKQLAFLGGGDFSLRLIPAAGGQTRRVDHVDYGTDISWQP
jgi:TolB protein